MTEPYDLFAIGAGPAGESAAELAAFYGHRSVVIEKNRPGGTVTTTGGAPTKTLREAALYLTGFRDRDIYGLLLAVAPDIVLPTIRKRTRDVSELLQRVTADNIAKHNVDYLQGNARLGPGRSLLVMTPDGRELTLRAKAILIASGSHPMRPKKHPVRRSRRLRLGHNPSPRAPTKGHLHRGRRGGWGRVRNDFPRTGRARDARGYGGSPDAHDGRRDVPPDGRAVPQVGVTVVLGAAADTIARTAAGNLGSLALNRRQIPTGHGSVRRRTNRQHARTGLGCCGRKDRLPWQNRRR